MHSNLISVIIRWCFQLKYAFFGGVQQHQHKKKSILTHTTPLSVIFCLFIHVRQLLTTIKLQNVSGIHQKQQFATTFSLINNNDTNLMNSNFLLNYIIIIPLDEYDDTTKRRDTMTRKDATSERKFGFFSVFYFYG